MPRPSVKHELIQAGLRVLFRKGFNGCGVREVVAEAGVPQGSFTNHFRSKERFATEVLDAYFQHVRTLVAEALGDPRRTPRERLERYFDLVAERLAADGFTRGCLIGDLSLEVVQQSEDLRQRLRQVYAEWLAPFEACIAEAQRLGEIDASIPARDLAEFVISSWEGAIMRMKVERTREPLTRQRRILFETVLATSRTREK